MSRSWQLFEGPDPDDRPLPTPPSPWIEGQLVRLPLEHWQIVVDFAAKSSPDVARQLSGISFAAAGQDDDRIALEPSELQSLLKNLERLALAIRQAEPLVRVATAAVPDEFVNEEHARMVEAVRAVVTEALRLGLPFRAWID